MTTLPENTIELPDFDLVANLFVEEGIQVVSPSELHGLFSGQLAAGVRLDADAILRNAAQLMDVNAFKQENTKVALLALYQCTLAQFESNDMDFTVLLPADDEELAQRVSMLGCWCSGFLAGFGLQGKHSNSTLSSDTRESLQDLSQIAQIELEGEETDDNESDMMEVQEYVRMAALMLFTECNTADISDKEESKPSQPTVH